MKGASGQESASLSGSTVTGRADRHPTLVNVELAAKERREASARFATAIRVAHRAGQSLRRIAGAAGLSHSRVFQILHEEVKR